MAGWLLRIVKSFFALPAWVIIWICVFLIPVNFAGFWFLDTPTGRWVAVLGAGAIILNLVPVLINGGMSKVLAIPHLVLWGPLVVILGVTLAGGGLTGAEWMLALAVFIVDGISLFFDVHDTRQWWRGNRAVTGFEDEPVRF